MKIQGPNPYINIYRDNQRTKNMDQHDRSKSDKLKISEEALQLLQNDQRAERKEKVEQIKSLVQSDEYKVNYGATAEKMIEFWRNS